MVEAVENVQELTVECPEGCSAGDLLNIEVDGTRVEVAVPDGVEPGDIFNVLLQVSADAEEDGTTGKDDEAAAFSAGVDAPGVSRSFELLVLANKCVPTHQTVLVEARDLDELSVKVGASVGVTDAVICSPSDVALDETMYTSLEEIGEMESVMVWEAAAFGDESTAEVADTRAERDFILLVQENEHVKTNKKLKLKAATLYQLYGNIKEALQWHEDLTLTQPTAVPQQKDCFSSLSEVESKAKVMVWPAATLRHLYAVSAVEQRGKVDIEEATVMQSQPAESTEEPPGDPFDGEDEIGDKPIDGTNWTQCIQAVTGRVYYWNSDTDETSWELPEFEVEGGEILKERTNLDTTQPEPEPEPEPEPPAEPLSADEDDEEQQEQDEGGNGDDNEQQQQQQQQQQEEEEEEEEGGGEEQEEELVNDDYGSDSDYETREKEREATEALRRYSRKPVDTPSPIYLRSADRTPRSSRRHGRSSSSSSSSIVEHSSSRRRRRRRTRRSGEEYRSHSRRNSGENRSPIIVRGPAFDSSCHPLQPPPSYDPTRDKYMPPEYRKRIAEKRKAIERAQALDHQRTVLQRYERLGTPRYDDDDYSDDNSDDLSYSDGSECSSEEDEHAQDAQHDTPETAGGNSNPGARRGPNSVGRSRSSDTDPVRSPRGKPIPGSVALQHRVSVRPSDCDRFGDLSAGSGVQFCFDAIDVWSSKFRWRAVVSRSSTHWVRRVRSGEEIVMTVEVCSWRRDDSFDMSFDARVEGEDVFRTDCRFEGLMPTKDGAGWVSASPPEAFKRLWSE